MGHRKALYKAGYGGRIASSLQNVCSLLAAIVVGIDVSVRVQAKSMSLSAAVIGVRVQEYAW